MSDLVAFLRARLDEDLAVATAVKASRHGMLMAPPTQEEQAAGRYDHHVLDGDRLLAEVDAKRRIVEEHHEDDGSCWGCGFGNDGERLYGVDDCPTKRLLALPCAGHPDYDPAWRPE